MHETAIRGPVSGLSRVISDRWRFNHTGRRQGRAKQTRNRLGWPARHPRLGRSPHPQRPAAGERASFELWGDSATAERSAGQDVHPHQAFRLVSRCFSAQS